jgi:hypothetical protein
VVGALRPPASPPKGSAINVFRIDDESTMNHLCSIYSTKPMLATQLH